MKTNSSNNHIINICGIEPESIVDGPGFRYVIFVQGCPHHCKGCHNPESWPFEGGSPMTVEEIYSDITSRPHIHGVTYSGGEPFSQSEGLIQLSELLKKSGYNIMGYSGYTYEELTERNDKLLDYLDILVDGPYVESLRNLTLRYRGSENQRVIDLNKTRTNNRITLYQSEYDTYK